MQIQAICVYCGSSERMPKDYLEAAQRMGTAIARQGLTLVYGAGSTGMMGAVANAALQVGGEVIGVIPEMFNTPVLVHTGLTRLEVVADMHVRKARLVQLADAFIALPGGFGTLDELFEILTWAQVGLHRKPIGLLNTNGYFDTLLQWVEHAKQEGFIYTEHSRLFTWSDQPEKLLAALRDHQYPTGLERWLTRES